MKNFLQKITDLREKCAYIKIYEIICDHIFSSSKTLILAKISDFSILNHVKAQVGHFLQNLKRGSFQKNLKKLLPKIADLREKCAYIKIYEIICDYVFSLSKTLILAKILDFSILNHVVASGVFRTSAANL